MNNKNITLVVDQESKPKKTIFQLLEEKYEKDERRKAYKNKVSEWANNRRLK